MRRLPRISAEGVPAVTHETSSKMDDAVPKNVSAAASTSRLMRQCTTMIKHLTFIASLFLCAAAPLSHAAPATSQAHTMSIPALLKSMAYRERLIASMADIQTRLPKIVTMVAIEAAQPAQASMNAGDRAAALERLHAGVPAIAAAVAPMLGNPATADALITEVLPEFASHFTPAELQRLSAFYGKAGAAPDEEVVALTEKALEIAERKLVPRLIAAIEKQLPGSK